MKSLGILLLAVCCLGFQNKDGKKKEISGSVNVSPSKIKSETMEKINDEIYQLKYISRDSKSNTYMFSGSIAVYYTNNKGVANTGFSIGSNHAINDKQEIKENAGYFNFQLTLKNSGESLNYKFTKFMHHGNGEIGNGGDYDSYPECGSEKIGGIPNWDSYKKQSDEECENIIKKLSALFE